MAHSSFDLFDPRTFITDSPPEEGCDHGDFGFAFSDSNFSDRVLRIYIIQESLESTQSPSAIRVKTVHVSSAILAGRSPFFFKLFSNGMRESRQFYVTLRINASEEDAFMELLKFMYTNTLTVTTATDALDVLIAADKFDVASCIRYCGRLLRNLTMTPDQCVLVYLNLPSTILMTPAFQPLTVAAKQFYAVHYKDITKFEDEILGLPLDGLEVIISCDALRVTEEDAVYKFVLKWARAQYPKIEDRRDIIRTRLAKFIRYPYLSYGTLIEVLNCNEFDLAFARKVYQEAISFKTQDSQLPTYIDDENSNIYHRFVKRVYTFRPLKMVEFKQPRRIRRVLYLDLIFEECASMFPSGEISSELVNINGQGFYFQALHHSDQHSSNFVLLLGVIKKKDVHHFVFDYEFAVRSKPAEEFVSKLKGCYSETGGFICLYAIPWTSFIGEDNVYFIGGVLHLRIELAYNILTESERGDENGSS